MSSQNITSPKGVYLHFFIFIHRAINLHFLGIIFLSFGKCECTTHGRDINTEIDEEKTFSTWIGAWFAGDICVHQFF